MRVSVYTRSLPPTRALRPHLSSYPLSYYPPPPHTHTHLGSLHSGKDDKIARDRQVPRDFLFDTPVRAMTLLLRFVKKYEYCSRQLYSLQHKIRTAWLQKFEKIEMKGREKERKKLTSSAQCPPPRNPPRVMGWGVVIHRGSWDTFWLTSPVPLRCSALKGTSHNEHQGVILLRVHKHAQLDEEKPTPLPPRQSSQSLEQVPLQQQKPAIRKKTTQRSEL